MVWHGSGTRQHSAQYGSDFLNSVRMYIYVRIERMRVKDNFHMLFSNIHMLFSSCGFKIKNQNTPEVKLVVAVFAPGWVVWVCPNRSHNTTARSVFQQFEFYLPCAPPRGLCRQSRVGQRLQGTSSCSVRLYPPRKKTKNCCLEMIFWSRQSKTKGAAGRPCAKHSVAKARCRS